MALTLKTSTFQEKALICIHDLRVLNKSAGRVIDCWSESNDHLLGGRLRGSAAFCAARLGNHRPTSNQDDISFSIRRLRCQRHWPTSAVCKTLPPLHQQPSDFHNDANDTNESKDSESTGYPMVSIAFDFRSLFPCIRVFLEFRASFINPQRRKHVSALPRSKRTSTVDEPHLQIGKRGVLNCNSASQ